MDRKKQQLTGFERLGKQITSLFLAVLVVMLAGVTCATADAVSGQKSTLETMRAGRHEGYTSVVFQFGGQFSFSKPTRSGEEIQFTIHNVQTGLIPYREYHISKAWIRLEPAGDDISVRVGFLDAFTSHRYYTLKNPDRLVINLIWPDDSEQAPVQEIGMGAEKTQQAPATDPIDNLIKTESQDIAPVVTSVSQPDSIQVAPATPVAKPAIEPPEPVVPEVVAVSQVEKSMTEFAVPPVQPTLSQPEPEDPVEEAPPLSLNFFQSDIQEVLTALAIQQNLNIVTAKDVLGNVTVHLTKVSFDKALGAICQAGGFDYYKRNDVYYVYKPKKESEQGYDDLKMEIFKLEYAEIDKIQEVLDAIPHLRLIKIHEPTKTIVVEDTAENIEKVHRLIRHWDVKPRQVLIEAKILEITLTDAMSFGVNWESMLGGNLAIGTSGISLGELPGREGESPSPSDGVGFFGNFITGAGTDWQFAAALDALEAETDVDTLSTPKILALHGKAAQVQVGGQQGYTVTTVSDGIATTSVEFIDTGTILDITPYIDTDNNVLLKVEPSINSASIEEGVPVVRSTNVTTWMMAANGETVFIGGLIQNTQTSLESSVPCLGDIPILGNLFGRTSDVSKKTELIVLITPHVVLDDIDIYREEIERTDAFEENLK